MKSIKTENIKKRLVWTAEMKRYFLDLVRPLAKDQSLPLKNDAWEQIGLSMAQAGYTVTKTQMKDKWIQFKAKDDAKEADRTPNDLKLLSDFDILDGMRTPEMSVAAREGDNIDLTFLVKNVEKKKRSTRTYSNTDQLMQRRLRILELKQEILEKKLRLQQLKIHYFKQSSLRNSKTR